MASPCNRLPPHWQLKTQNQDPILAKKLGDEFNISPLTAQLLLNRGISDSAKIKAFLYPSLQDLPPPELLKGLDEAVARILQAIDKGEAITVFGDYDVDGITASALLYSFFELLGIHINVIIPNRFTEGYGLTHLAIPGILGGQPKPNLLITVDCGIRSVSEIDELNRAGMDSIVTDHHEPAAELPPACAVINPKQKGCSFPFKEMAGVGVAFYLCIGIRSALKKRDYHFPAGAPPNLRALLDLVAVGTVCDMVPLIGVNRTFSKIGMELISRPVRPGLIALKEVSSLTPMEPVTAYDLGFKIGPRLNAAGRLQNADVGLKCLISKEMDQARQFALDLDRQNQERRALEEKTIRGAEKRIEAIEGFETQRSLVLEDPHWHSGIIGIVASKLVDRYHRPTILFTHVGPHLKGSARGTKGIHLTNIFAEMAKAHDNLFVAFGGHEKAAGLTINKDLFERFKKSFETILSEKGVTFGHPPLQEIDCEVWPEALSLQFIKEFQLFEPFGLGNPKIRFACHIDVLPQFKILKSKHLLLHFKGEKGTTIPIIGFNHSEKITRHLPPFWMLYTPQINSFNNKTTFQPQILEIIPVSNADNTPLLDSPSVEQQIEILDT